MQRGRKPKPVAQLKLERTYDGSRHRRRQCEPAAEGNLADVDPPAWLTAEQKRAWRQAIKDAPKGVLKACRPAAVFELHRRRGKVRTCGADAKPTRRHGIDAAIDPRLNRDGDTVAVPEQ